MGFRNVHASAWSLVHATEHEDMDSQLGDTGTV